MTYKSVSSGTRLLAVAAMLIGVVGCGQEGPELAPVTGIVTYKGEPLKTGIVQFHPAAGRQARGKIVEGQIREVTTFDPGDGAMVGEHQVSIFSFVRPQVGFDVPPSVIPVRYNDPTTSELVVRIESGKTNDLKLELTD